MRVAAYSTNIKLTKSYIDEILERIALTDVGNKPSKEFSLGMKRRLQLAMTTMIKKMIFNFRRTHKWIRCKRNNMD